MIFIMGAIFFLSHQSGSEISLPSFYGADKVAHFIAYTVLGCTIVYAHKINSLTDSKLRVCAFVILGCFLYGVSDEFHQSFIDGRFSSLSDIIADTAGGLFVAIILFIWPERMIILMQKMLWRDKER